MSNTIINTNVMALNSHRALSNVGNRQAVSSERLSTGMRINRAADDAAGLSISEKMRSQIRGLDQASRNSQDGISLIQTAEGALQEVQDITQRIRELTVQAANDTLVTEDRNAIQTEVSQLVTELGNIIERTSFNGQALLAGETDATDNPTGPANGTINIQNGSNSNERLTITVPDFRNDPNDDEYYELVTGAGGVDNLYRADSGQLRHLMNMLASADSVGDADEDNNVSLNLGSHERATATLTLVDDALREISSNRSDLGALQNRLEHTINNLNIASENTSAAESRIRDTDMAREMMQLTQANVLQQAATSMLAQANQSPQGVLQLLN